MDLGSIATIEKFNQSCEDYAKDKTKKNKKQMIKNFEYAKSILNAELRRKSISVDEYNNYTNKLYERFSKYK